MLFRVCVACDHTNPPDSRFCGKCGAPLQVRFCRLCRSPNDAVSRHCQSCGTELPELAEPEAALPSNGSRSATIPPLVIATPGRPVGDTAPAPFAAPTTTTAAALPGGEVPANAAGAPALDETRALPAGATGDQPAIDALPQRPAGSASILVDSAVANANLTEPANGARQSARARRGPWAALALAVAVLGVAFGAFAYKAWRNGAATGPTERAVAPPPTAPAPPPRAQPDAPSPTPSPAPAAESAAPPAASASKAAPRERREAAPRAVERAPAASSAPAAPAMPALRECTPPVAALGLCTPEPKPEGN